MCTGLTLVTECGFFFRALLVQADGPLLSLKWDRPRCFPPSTFCTAGRLIDTLCTCFLVLICSHTYYISHYISLFPFILSLPESLPERASRCSATGLTGDNKPVSSSRRPPCDKSNNRLLLSVSASVYHQGAALLYLIMGKRHRAFQKCSASLLLAE